jgi:monofunctional glycosyltransferase
VLILEWIGTGVRKLRRVFSFSGFVFVLSVVTVVGAIGLTAWGYRLVRGEFPDVSILKKSYPQIVYQGKDQPFRTLMQGRRPPGWVSIQEVSRVAVGAIVVSEDWAFFQHSGYDANQIQEAIKEDWNAGRFVRGASTITQQVVRNVFLSQEKNLWRKIKELILSVQLEEAVGKHRILETYLNIAEWGEGVFGIRAASQKYFGKEPSQLTAKEGAFLAMLLPSPKRYSQSFRRRQLTAYARETVQSILHKMTQAHYLSEEERDEALVSPLPFESVPQEAL